MGKATVTNAFYHLMKLNIYAKPMTRNFTPRKIHQENSSTCGPGGRYKHIRGRMVSNSKSFEGTNTNVLSQEKGNYFQYSYKSFTIK